MSEAAELTEGQTTVMIAELERLQTELRAFLAGSEDGARPVALDEPIGRLSRMDAMQQQSMVQANRRAMRVRVQLVESALERAAAGDYGWCLNCEEPVGFSRLRVQPEATLCIACQSARESEQS